MDNYVLSRYNCFKIIDDTVIGVNLYRGVLFALDIDKYNIIMKFSDDIISLKNSEPVLFSLLLKLGVIAIDNNDDRYKSLLFVNRETLFNSHEYRLTINPTLNCNFSCWYCYESHNSKRINKKGINAIIAYVDNLLSSKRISNFALDWFGGEPLLCYDTILVVALEIKKICEKYEVEFESGITTNGYLIKKEMIDIFKTINMRSFQITIDGNRNNHDNVRFLKNKNGTYDKIVSNMILLARDLMPDNLAVRINFTANIFDNLLDIVNDFPVDVRNKITILIQQVWQDKDENSLSIADLEYVKTKFREAGFKTNNEIFNLKGYTCYADLYNQAVINYDGRVFKCTARNFEKEKEDGILLDDGTIEWNIPLLSSKLAQATFENNKCSVCNYLPVCFGPCSQKISSLKSMGDFDKYCFKNGIKNTIDYVLSEFHKTGKSLSHILNYYE